jgi:hypothetical protein
MSWTLLGVFLATCIDCLTDVDGTRLHAGVHSLWAGQTTSVSFMDTIFDDMIQEYEAETRDAQEGSHEVAEV